MTVLRRLVVAVAIAALAVIGMGGVASAGVSGGGHAANPTGNCKPDTCPAW
jgi:hypothetical protein